MKLTKISQSAINRLPEEIKEKLNRMYYYSDGVIRSVELQREQERKSARNQLYGYLCCLKDMKLINETEQKQIKFDFCVQQFDDEYFQRVVVSELKRLSELGKDSKSKMEQTFYDNRYFVQLSDFAKALNVTENELETLYLNELDYRRFEDFETAFLESDLDFTPISIGYPRMLREESTVDIMFLFKSYKYAMNYCDENYFYTFSKKDYLAALENDEHYEFVISPNRHLCLSMSRPGYYGDMNKPIILWERALTENKDVIKSRKADLQ